MDDISFQHWSETLKELREHRQRSIDAEIQNKAESFTPSDFFNLAQTNLERVMEKWLEIEKESWQAEPPADLSAAADTVRSEMESIFYFELESIERDKTSIQSHITWLPDALKAAEPLYKTYIDDLHRKYLIKVAGLVGGSKKRAVEPPPAAIHAGYSGRSYGGSGIGFFLMFLVGFLLGGGPSVYFWDLSKKAEAKYQEERSKLLADQRALSDSITLVKDGFDQLALGKAKNIPVLESEIQKITSSFVEKMREVERNHLKERERTLKKMPAGNKLDSVLEALEGDKAQTLRKLQAQQTALTEPLLKQKNKLNTLLGH